MKSDFLCFSPVGSLVSDNGSHCSVSPQQEHSSGPLQQAAYFHFVKLCVLLNIKSSVKSGQRWPAGSELVRKVKGTGRKRVGRYICFIFSGYS